MGAPDHCAAAAYMITHTHTHIRARALMPGVYACECCPWVFHSHFVAWFGHVVSDTQLVQGSVACVQDEQHSSLTRDRLQTPGCSVDLLHRDVGPLLLRISRCMNTVQLFQILLARPHCYEGSHGAASLHGAMSGAFTGYAGCAFSTPANQVLD